MRKIGLPFYIESKPEQRKTLNIKQQFAREKGKLNMESLPNRFKTF
jgi:hypothetical protein